MYFYKLKQATIVSLKLKHRSYVLCVSPPTKYHRLVIQAGRDTQFQFPVRMSSETDPRCIP